jgi:ATP-dependent Clp protease adaptor protein ClpS
MTAPVRTRPATQPSSDPVPDLGPLFRVIIHNDDVTPMDFVVHILARIFAINGVAAVQIMYTAHHHGSAYVQSLPKQEAQRRIGQAHFAASLKGYPLQLTMEPE